MSTITREFTKEQLQQIIETDHVQCGEASALARIALASLEAEAVGEVVLGEHDDCGCHPDARVVCIAADGQADWENFKDGTRLYAAPPETVSVPECFKRLLHHAYGMTMGHDWNKGTMAGHHRDKLCQAVEDCRAAMLQGAEPVTTAYKLPPHIFRELVNRLRDTAVKYQGCQQLREQLSRTMQEVIQPAAPHQEMTK